MQDSTSLRSFLHDSDLFAQTQGYFITWHEISIDLTWLAASDRSHGALIMFHGFLPPPHSACSPPALIDQPLFLLVVLWTPTTGRDRPKSSS